ncbi:pro-neuregulin-4, membrane-bound isoform [Geospiza fortis]|uniref:Pro-neuregulin-4, membrane-bound isoform n=11 Tax=Neoaves TaxID=3078114 RepID=A0A8N5EI43_GEOFO|nr:pro-neuregulin-4, membrane-bound isoform [Geospiza fortis]
MRTDHEELCGTSYGSFCLNGGICYMIPTVSSPFCRCIENYTGARCEEVLLPSIKSQTKGDLFAAFLASLLLLGVLVIGAFYFLCRKVSIPRISSSECGANLVETTSSNGCNSEYSLKLNDWTPQGKWRRKFLLLKVTRFIFQK